MPPGPKIFLLSKGLIYLGLAPAAAIAIPIIILLALFVTAAGKASEIRVWTIFGRTIFNPTWLKRFVQWIAKFQKTGWWIFGAAAFSIAYSLILGLGFTAEGKAFAEQNGLTAFVNRALATAYILPAIVFAPIAKEPLNRLFAYLLGKYQKNTAEILEDLRSWRLEHSHDLVEIFEKAHLSMSGPGKVIGEVARQIAIHVRLAFIRISPPNLPEVKVRIFEVQKGKIIRELAMAPANATRVTPLTVIQDPKSTAMQAVNSKKIQIIPDIKIEVAHGAKSKYFCPSSEDKENAVGSLICYPVQRRTNDEVVAVICIRNAGEHAFDKANSKFYEQELGLYEADLVFSAIFDSANEDN